MNNKLKVMMDFHADVDNMDVRENPNMTITDKQQLMIDAINKEEEKILLGKEDSDSDEDHFSGFSSGQSVGGGHMRYEQWIKNLQSQQHANSHVNTNNVQFAVQQKKHNVGLGPRITHKRRYVL